MTFNVLIAGAGPGVSGSLARLYAAEGAAVTLLGADDEVLGTLRGEVEAAGGTAETAVVDLTDVAGTREAISNAGERAGHFDVVHFNPSAYREKDPLSLLPAELLHDVRLGVGALLTVVQSARPYLRSGSRITVTGSMAADQPWHGAASLGVQKAGVQNLVHSIDATLKDDDIRAVSVTVRGLLAKEGAFTPDKVAVALRAAVDQDAASWRSEIPYSG